MIRKIPLILAGMAALALGLPLQGAAGAVASGGGATWQIVPSPNPGTFPTLLAVAASSASDAWTVGHYANSTNSTYFSLAEHWNGSAWSVVSTPNPFGNENILTSVADLSPANAWAAGYSVDATNFSPVYQPLIEHWDGTAWTAVPAASDPTGQTDLLSGVAAVSATDVWAVGNHFDAAIGGQDGLIEHWDGSRWSIVPSPTSAASLYSVAAISASDVWAAGEAQTGGQPIFEHWDGTAWTAVSSPLVSSGYVAAIGLAAVSASDVWAVGTTRELVRGAPYQTLSEHWDGHKWSIVTSPDPITGNNVLIQAAAVSGSDVWAVGYDYSSTGGAAPLVANWNGKKWTTVQVPVPSGTQYNEFAAVAALSTGTVWAVGRSDYEELIINTSNG